jgi:hypothetical protein
VNRNLQSARRVRNDEFFTRYEDIDREIREYGPDVFRGASVLCPCDDWQVSQFSAWFRDHSTDLGLRRLVSTCHVPGGRGRIQIVTESGSHEGLLDGDGDFRSAEVSRLRDEADIVVTNPPFSLLREFVAWSS